MDNVGKESNRVEKTKKAKKVKDYTVKPLDVIIMVILAIIAVFVVIEVKHLADYTIGKEIDINKMWLYEYVLNIGK